MIMKKRKPTTDMLVGLNIIILLMMIHPTAVSAQRNDDHGHSLSASGSGESAPPSAVEPGAASTVVYSLGDIVVTAEQIEEYIKNHPQNVVRLDADEIRQRNFLSAAEALGTMPGVDVNQQSGGLGTRVSIRGGGGSGSVLVLVDGRPVNTGQYGGVNLGTIPVDTIDKIIVFKPPVPVWLGPGGTAGAISITTKNAKERPSDSSVAKKAGGRLQVSGGSYGTADASCSYTLPHGNGGALLSAGYGHTDGKRTNSDKDSGFLGLNWDTKDSRDFHYKIGGRYYHAEHGCPGPLYNLTPDADQTYDKGALDLGITGGTGPAGEFSIKSYVDYEDLEDRSQQGDKSMLEVIKAGLSGEHTWAGNGEWALRLGGKYERDSVDHTGTGGIVGTGRHHRDKESLHVQYDRSLDKLSFSVGLRSDHTSDFNYAPAANAGASYGLNEALVFKVNAGYAENIPSFGQLYQPSHGSYDQARGNPGLTEEKVVSYNVGMEYKRDKDLVVQVALFHTGTRDLIVYERGEDLISRPVNINRGTKQGLEFSCKYDPWERFSVDINYIVQETENHDTGGELNYVPDHTAKLTLKYRPADGPRLEGTLKAVSRQYTDIENADDTKLSAYTNVDLKIIQPVRIRSFKPELFVHFYNLFDSDHETHYGYPDDGFRFICGLNLNL